MSPLRTSSTDFDDVIRTGRVKSLFPGADRSRDPPLAGVDGLDYARYIHDGRGRVGFHTSIFQY